MFVCKNIQWVLTRNGFTLFEIILIFTTVYNTANQRLIHAYIQYNIIILWDIILWVLYERFDAVAVEWIATTIRHAAYIIIITILSL